MAGDPSSQSSGAEAKELLLQDFRYFTDSFWKNEQIGETRVNWLIGLVTAAGAGLASLASKQPGGEELWAIAVAAIAALFVFGLVTLLRILKRNEETDNYKYALDAIRQTFRDYFDGKHILEHYTPFPKDKSREAGGLAYNVAAINGLLAAALVGTLLYPRTSALLALSAGAVAFFIGLFSQHTYIRCQEKTVRSKLRASDPTHAGGIVFRRQQSTIEYLLVGPEKEEAGVWVLPKGHIEPKPKDHIEKQRGKSHAEAARDISGKESGERHTDAAGQEVPEEKRREGHTDAAVREVWEETGVIARMICLVGTNAYSEKGEEVRCKYYLMEALRETSFGEGRRKGWFSIDDAFGLLKHKENKVLLQQAEWRRLKEGLPS